jgi:hypothetical protein
MLSGTMTKKKPKKMIKLMKNKINEWVHGVYLIFIIIITPSSLGVHGSDKLPSCLFNSITKKTF